MSLEPKKEGLGIRGPLTNMRVVMKKSAGVWHFFGASKKAPGNCIGLLKSFRVADTGYLSEKPDLRDIASKVVIHGDPVAIGTEKDFGVTLKSAEKLSFFGMLRFKYVNFPWGVGCNKFCYRLEVPIYGFPMPIRNRFLAKGAKGC